MADAAPNPNQPDAAPNPGNPDAMPDPMAVTLSHSSSQNITAGNAVACVQTNSTTMEQQGHTDNSYYRVYDLTALGVSGDLAVDNVQIGIESATAASGSQPATVRLHTLTGSLDVAAPALTLITSQAITVANQDLSVLDVPISATVPAGSKLVIEVFTPDSTPDGANTGDLLFMGSNTAAQTAPSYIKAADCGVNQPTDTTGSAIGSTMHMVLNVQGTTQ